MLQCGKEEISLDESESFSHKGLKVEIYQLHAGIIMQLSKIVQLQIKTYKVKLRLDKFSIYRKCFGGWLIIAAIATL